MDGDRSVTRRKGSGTKRSRLPHIRDLDGKLLDRIEGYAEQRGLTLSDAARQLIVKGLDATEADAVQLHELIPSLHEMIDALNEKVPAELDSRIPPSQAFNRLLLANLIEVLMLARALATNSLKPEAISKAKKASHDAYQGVLTGGNA